MTQGNTRQRLHKQNSLMYYWQLGRETVQIVTEFLIAIKLHFEDYAFVLCVCPYSVSQIFQDITIDYRSNLAGWFVLFIARSTPRQSRNFQLSLW